SASRYLHRYRATPPELSPERARSRVCRRRLGDGQSICASMAGMHDDVAEGHIATWTTAVFSVAPATRRANAYRVPIDAKGGDQHPVMANWARSDDIHAGIATQRSNRCCALNPRFGINTHKQYLIKNSATTHVVRCKHYLYTSSQSRVSVFKCFLDH